MKNFIDRYQEDIFDILGSSFQNIEGLRFPSNSYLRDIPLENFPDRLVHPSIEYIIDSLENLSDFEKLDATTTLRNTDLIITPERTKEVLESLSGENRLDASAIKNLEHIDPNLITTRIPEGKFNYTAEQNTSETPAAFQSLFERLPQFTKFLSGYVDHDFISEIGTSGYGSINDLDPATKVYISYNTHKIYIAAAFLGYQDTTARGVTTSDEILAGAFLVPKAVADADTNIRLWLQDFEITVGTIQEDITTESSFHIKRNTKTITYRGIEHVLWTWTWDSTNIMDADVSLTHTMEIIEKPDGIHVYEEASVKDTLTYIERELKDLEKTSARSAGVPKHSHVYVGPPLVFTSVENMVANPLTFIGYIHHPGIEDLSGWTFKFQGLPQTVTIEEIPFTKDYSTIRFTISRDDLDTTQLNIADETTALNTNGGAIHMEFNQNIPGAGADRSIPIIIIRP